MTKAKRQSNGRFGSGNPGKPKGARMKRPAVASLRDSFNATITDADLTALWTKLKELAKEGDLNAIRMIQERAWGKDSNAGRGSEILALPDMNTPSDVRAAESMVVTAYNEGRISGVRYDRLLRGLDGRRKTIEAEDLQAQIDELKRAQGTEA